MWLEIGQYGFELIGQVTGNWGNWSIIAVCVKNFYSGLQIE